MKIVVVLIGARMHYAVPIIFNRNKVLAYFFTDFYRGNKRWLKRLTKYLPNICNWKKANTRVGFGLPNDKIISFDLFGIQYKLRYNFQKNRSGIYKNYLWAGSYFNKLVSTFLRSKALDFDTIYTFNSASLDLMLEYKGKKRLVLEQCIAPHAIELKLLTMEAEKNVGWEEIDPKDVYVDRFVQKEIRELELADVIISPSEFVSDSIIEINPKWGKKIKLVPYGVNINSNKFVNKKFEGEINVLTVGALGLRKGTPYILEAARYFNRKINFRLVGSSKEISSPKLALLKEYTSVIGQVSREEVNEHYNWANVFLLPSVCEGSATVTYEAMQYGLPLIVTKNTGSLVRDGIEGFVIETGTSDGLITALENIISNPSLIEEFSKNSFLRCTVANLDSYESRLMQALCR